MTATQGTWPSLWETLDDCAQKKDKKAASDHLCHHREFITRPQKPHGGSHSKRVGRARAPAAPSSSRGPPRRVHPRAAAQKGSRSARTGATAAGRQRAEVEVSSPQGRAA